MIVLPVIARELRAEARHAFTYWLRVLGAGALMAVAWFTYHDAPVAASQGSALFGMLQRTLFICTWMFVPLVTADCISREKRQGTLGLLFLTPLRPSDVIIAKTLVHGLRSLALCLAVLPVLTIPFLMGGVPWTDVIFSVLIIGGSFCLALSAGLLASAWNTRWTRSLATAVLLSGLFLLLFISLNGSLFHLLIPTPAGFFRRRSFWQSVFEGAAFTWGPGVGGMLFSGPILPLKYVQGALAVFLWSFTFLIFNLVLCATKIRRAWREEPPSALQIWIHDLFCQPMFLLPLFHRWMRRALEKNPIGWLEQRTWRGRLVTWSWFGILVSFYSFVLSDTRFHGEGFIFLQNLLALGLALSISATAAGSFQRERETGLLELLLVSPLKIRHILLGRLRGIWGQFLLVILLWFAVWIYFAKTFAWRNWDYFSIAGGFCASSFLSLPVIGLYCSLRCRHFMTGFLSTLVVGLFFPMFLAGIWERFQNLGDYPDRFSALLFLISGGLRVTPTAALLQLFFALWLAICLHRNLAHRKFALERRE